MTLSGHAIADVGWIDSETPGYARFFIRLDSGESFEVSATSIVAAAFPAEAGRDPQFSGILGRGKIAEIRTDDQTDLAIRLDTGHVLHLFGTFDGENPGNNFCLEGPEEAREWAAEFLELRRLV